MSMHRAILAALVVGMIASGCNNRSRGGVTTDPLCPTATVSTDDFCDDTQAGITCAGTLSCPCGIRSTTCACVMDSLGYRFECVDSCSCPSTDGGPGSAQCGAVYDRLQASPCPFSDDIATRADFVAICDQAGTGSAACRAELDTFLACALSAPIECMDAGGTQFPSVPSCPPLSSGCLE